MKIYLSFLPSSHHLQGNFHSSELSEDVLLYPAEPERRQWVTKYQQCTVSVLNAELDIGLHLMSL